MDGTIGLGHDRAVAELYVNPSCSKCAQATSVLAGRSVSYREVRYLDEPPTVGDLRRLMELLGIDDPNAMIRTSDELYTSLGLQSAGPDALLEAVAAHPILLQRPIFVVGDRAVIARPPERLLELLAASEP